ncbi:MAG: DUF1080 domain-containing protein [Akkermansiaceae bacterium]|jgi:hypothetical protein|nr:DUF1080 domain-containing protein [Akkermansiaceae bacterium]
MTRTSFSLGFLSFTALCGAAFGAEAWVPLFNGSSLDGWVQRGGKAAYTVEDGCIVGTSTLNTANSFLCTPRDYADFVFEYEFKVDSRLNSGVQIRSQCFDQPTEFVWAGKTVKVPANRVHGYQVEIDPEPGKNRWWSAGIYEEGARGWLYPGMLGGDGKTFTAQGGRIFKQNDWNKVRVVAVGHSITTTLNGTPCADIIDSRVPAGFIGLQVHGIGNDKAKDGAQVRWRNLRIMEIPPAAPNTLNQAEQAAGWRLLWDGKTTSGWRSAGKPGFPEKGWSVADGDLIVEGKGGGDIITEEKFSNFELVIDFKLTPKANSGIKLFVDAEKMGKGGASLGPEFQILDDDLHPDAKLGRDGNRKTGALYDLIPAAEHKKLMPVGEWNQARIRSEGPRVTFWLNGVKTLSFERGSDEWRQQVAASKFKKVPGFGELPEGHILMQDHGDRVHFRNLKLRPLTAADR